MFANIALCRCFAFVIASLVLIQLPAPLFAQQSDRSVSANSRVNFAGKLRMLSQRAAAAGCNLAAGVDKDKSRQILMLTSGEFEKILNGLKNGSSDLNITGAETDEAVLGVLNAVNEKWVEFDSAIAALVRDPPGDAVDTINAENMSLLASAQDLVNSVLQSYTDNSANDSGFGKTIDIAGRQRMLTQKMSKEACQIWSNHDVDNTIAALVGTIELFETSLIGLWEGSEGLIKPPNDRVEQGLEVVWNHWTAIKPELQNALDKKEVSQESRAELFTALNQTLRDMNSVVGLYAVAQKEQGNISDEGASERVNFSGKLRMLSQRVAATACNYVADVEKEQSKSMLLSAQAEILKITRALELGDADLRIYGNEKRRKTLEALANVRNEWEPINSAIEDLLQGQNLNKNLTVISESSMPLLDAAKLLVSEISGQYSDPSVMTQADAMLVDISGRQRMFTQKMSKESCLIWSGLVEKAEDLSNTMQTFEISLQALRNGLESAGIRPAPTAEIMYGLDEIWEKWQSLKPSLQKAVSGETADVTLRGEIFKELNTVLVQMNAVVGMYTIHGKTGL